jgi:cob(I)alamin adenosyltransferase
MKIYTRTGDDGTTGLFGGERVPKASARVEAYGSVDELCAVLGTALAAPGGLAPPFVDVLTRVQRDLFVLGADLATPPGRETSYLPRLEAAHVAALERWIDEQEAELPPLRNFILPGGSPLAAQLHLARTVCRRAERATVALAAEEAVGPLPVQYLNRLGDLLFVLARRANRLVGEPEHEWTPRGSEGA